MGCGDVLNIGKGGGGHVGFPDLGADKEKGVVVKWFPSSNVFVTKRKKVRVAQSVCVCEKKKRRRRKSVQRISECASYL